MDLEVRFALDTLVIYSSEEDLFLAQCPQLLNSLVEYFFEVMNKLYASCKAQRFYDYKTLYEMETLSNEVFQGSSEATIDEKGMLANKLAMLSMIFRNCSMIPDNVDLMGKHPGFAKVVILMLKVPVPIELEDFFENPETHIAQSLPCTTLEHRKNAVIVLSNIGGMFPIPNPPTLQLITSVCKDFISETDTAYVYPAVDCLAKIFIDAGNQAKIADLDGIQFLVEGLLLLIPTKAFPYEASKPLMALYELVMLLLCIITSNIRGGTREKVMTKQFAQHMLILSKRPAINYRATIPIEIVREFWSVRERALRIYLTCIKGKKLGDLVQTELILMMSIAQRDGDLWMSAAILEFMLDQE